MSQRLYHPPPLHSDQRLELDRDRAHYLIRVLRLPRGGTMEVFDGSGRAWTATLTDAGTRTATLTLGTEVADAAPPDHALHLVQGQLKGAAMDTVVQKATELGATDIWPVRAARSNVPGDPQRLARKVEHWQRVIESAAEQCGALHLPRLHRPRALGEFLADLPAARWLLLDPGAPTLPVGLPRADTGVLIGPEGGWDDAERRSFESLGAQRFALGSRILRGETAPLAVLAALRHGWGWP